MKLIPILVEALVNNSGCEYAAILFKKMLEEFKKNEFGLLDVMHHLSVGMKSVYTQSIVDGIIKSR